MLGLAAAAVVVLLVALPIFRGTSGPTIQLAMLDRTGVVRGSNDDTTAQFKQAWPGASVQSFASANDLRA